MTTLQTCERISQPDIGLTTRFLKAIQKAVQGWQQHRATQQSIRDLSHLPDYLLDDVGIPAHKRHTSTITPTELNRW